MKVKNLKLYRFMNIKKTLNLISSDMCSYICSVYTGIKKMIELLYVIVFVFAADNHRNFSSEAEHLSSTSSYSNVNSHNDNLNKCNESSFGNSTDCSTVKQRHCGGFLTFLRNAIQQSFHGHESLCKSSHTAENYSSPDSNANSSHVFDKKNFLEDSKACRFVKQKRIFTNRNAINCYSIELESHVDVESSASDQTSREKLYYRPRSEVISKRKTPTKNIESIESHTHCPSNYTKPNHQKKIRREHSPNIPKNEELFSDQSNNKNIPSTTSNLAETSNTSENEQKTGIKSFNMRDILDQNENKSCSKLVSNPTPEQLSQHELSLTCSSSSDKSNNSKNDMIKNTLPIAKMDCDETQYSYQTSSNQDNFNNNINRETSKGVFYPHHKKFDKKIDYTNPFDSNTKKLRNTINTEKEGNDSTISQLIPNSLPLSTLEQKIDNQKNAFDTNYFYSQQPAKVGSSSATKFKDEIKPKQNMLNDLSSGKNFNLNYMAAGLEKFSNASHAVETRDNNKIHP
ncbi:hypothetical protein EDEG_03609 [Edhazardia aedis USNM 41457]|uniref:Uncharacterized protein n=1 Tax=Edhazardia aedis (strain USNM 41457) TaxID=1003232 RepID=J9DKL1_EDHAE|nr:hypothetical protein EDEG_03609 [Edhazardia aedis USNM 41457]|eukprot:EJW01927.1 hypothetical protein EDEG_03609 [Edhazardia aedis USNM 41457]